MKASAGPILRNSQTCNADLWFNCSPMELPSHAGISSRHLPKRTAKDPRDTYGFWRRDYTGLLNHHRISKAWSRGKLRPSRYEAGDARFSKVLKVYSEAI